jgi:phenylacetate-CoA ligase
MSDFYDELEIQDLQAREQALFARLPAVLQAACAKAPGRSMRFDGVDVAGVNSREQLAGIPVLRKQDLSALQTSHPPFGGLNATAPGALARLFMSPGPIFEPEGHGRDWWGVARSLFAAGVRARDILLNSFSYHLTPAGHMFESGAHALGCAVIPAGIGNTELQLQVIAHYRPVGYAGTPDFLKVLLDKADETGVDASSIRHALVGGAALPASLRAEFNQRGVSTMQTFGTADLGIVAYESAALEGMIVNENLIVEIVRPGSSDPVSNGEVGELVVTRLNRDYPLIRFGTGDLSAVLPGASPCGRTNMRIKGWLGRADQRTKVKGMFVDPGQIDGVLQRHPEIAKARLVVDRHNERDVMTLQIESNTTVETDHIVETLRDITRLRGSVELVPTGSLPNDGKVITDNRSYD